MLHRAPRRWTRAWSENLTIQAAAHVVTCSEWTARTLSPPDPSAMRITTIMNWTEVLEAVPEPRHARANSAIRGVSRAYRRAGERAQGSRHGSLARHGGAAFCLQAESSAAWMSMAAACTKRSVFQIARDERLSSEVHFRERTGKRCRGLSVFSGDSRTPRALESFGMLAVEAMAQQTPAHRFANWRLARDHRRRRGRAYAFFRARKM